MKINRVGHVVLKVRDLDAAKAFYAGIMQMHITDEVPGFGVFFRFSDYHHDIGVFQVPHDSATQTEGHSGLAHLALVVDDMEALRAAYQHLKAAGADIISTANHGITQSIYLRDPDDNEIEIYCDDQRADWRDMPKIMKPPKPLVLD